MNNDDNLDLCSASMKDGMEFKIIRSQNAGVFAGYLEYVDNSISGRIAIMRNVRRLWYWSGAASLSQLAIDGTKKPNDCKFPAPVSRIEISNVIEVIDCTERARKSIQGVRVWQQ